MKMEVVENAEILEYLEGLQATGNTISYLQNMINIIRGLASQPIVGYHFSQTRREDGSLLFKGFWLFTQDYVIEVENVVEQDMYFDITYIYGGIERVEFYSENFDYDKPTEISSLRIIAHITQWYIDLEASGNNCLNLLKVYNEQIRKNLEFIEEEE